MDVDHHVPLYFSVHNFPRSKPLGAHAVAQNYIRVEVRLGLITNMAAVKALNPKAEVARSAAALHLNITAARGLQDVLKTNLGPKGTMKM